MDPEEAHHLLVNISKNINNQPLVRTLISGLYGYKSPRLTQNICNLTFPNPFGLAAGFDKNGKLPKLMEAIGFGFAEVGSITAQPSSGNPKPRLFRLPEDESLINRLGLNNDGAQTVCRRLEQQHTTIPIGVNIAKTNSEQIYGDRAIEDYVISYRYANRVADYITINISCPNTKEGKSFEDPAVLKKLLDALELRIDARRVPTFIKLSPDSDDRQLKNIVEVCEEFSIDGYVATNTTAHRPLSRMSTSSEDVADLGRGGLSGTILQKRSTEVIRLLRSIIGTDKPIIGVGGVSSTESALEKLKAGANLLQCYTGLVYHGPSLPGKVNRGIDKYLKKHHIESISHFHKHLKEKGGR